MIVTSISNLHLFVEGPTNAPAWALQMQASLATLTTDLATIKTDLATVKTDVATLTTTVQELQASSDARWHPPRPGSSL